MNKRKILVVNNNEKILEFIRTRFPQADYEIVKAETSEQALEALWEESPDIVLLEYTLAGMDGLDVLKSIRANRKFIRLPVIMLTENNVEMSKVIAFELGADDYITYPCGANELLARIKAVLRRTEVMIAAKEEREEETITVDHLVINRTTMGVMVGEKEVDLSLMEFDLLYFLVQNRGRVLSRDEILEKIKRHDKSVNTRTVDVHIRYLRKKIEEDDTNPVYLKTIRGVGYKFK